MKKFRSWLLLALLVAAGYYGYQFYNHYVLENKTLKEIIARLSADSRIAEAIVTDQRTDPVTGKQRTTIKFLEYDSEGRPLVPQYFTFHDNLIQFQSLVVRFDDIYVRRGDRLRGKSVYLFWKAFVLDKSETEEFNIAKINTIPEGYKIDGAVSLFEEQFWKDFWKYALDPQYAKKQGIKNAQVEAPGTKFIPGILYTLKIEHDGGIRIDASPIPAILRGEKIVE